MNHSSSTVVFNVGGKRFEMEKENLQREPESVFANIASGQFGNSIRDGVIFLDRNPTLFAYILDYLRGIYDTQLQHRFSQLTCLEKYQLLEEIDFFQLLECKDLLFGTTNGNISSSLFPFFSTDSNLLITVPNSNINYSITFSSTPQCIVKISDTHFIAAVNTSHGTQFEKYCILSGQKIMTFCTQSFSILKIHVLESLCSILVIYSFEDSDLSYCLGMIVNYETGMIIQRFKCVDAWPMGSDHLCIVEMINNQREIFHTASWKKLDEISCFSCGMMTYPLLWMYNASQEFCSYHLETKQVTVLYSNVKQVHTIDNLGSLIAIKVNDFHITILKDGETVITQIPFGYQFSHVSMLDEKHLCFVSDKKSRIVHMFQKPVYYVAEVSQGSNSKMITLFWNSTTQPWQIPIATLNFWYTFSQTL